MCGADSCVARIDPGNGAVVRTIGRFLRAYIPGKILLYVVGLSCLAVNIWCMTVVPSHISEAVDLLNENSEAAILTERARATLVELSWMIIALGVGLAVFRLLSRVVLFLPGRRIEAEIRRDFFKALTRLSPTQLSRFQLGDLISRGTSDVSTARVTVSMGVLHTAGSLFLFAMCSVKMLQISWVLTVLSVLIAPIVIPTVKKLSRKMMTQARVTRMTLGDLSESIRETFRAHTLVNIYPVFDQILSRYDAVNDRYRDDNERLIQIRVPLWSMMGSFASFSLFLLMVVGGYMIVGGDTGLTIGQLVEFSILLGLIQEPMRSGGMIISLFQRGEVSLERLYEILDAADEQDEQQESRPISTLASLLEQHDESAPLIQVNNLTFAYPEQANAEDHRDPFTLTIPDLRIEKGKRYGIFGSVGSGKTTLVKVLTGNIAIEPGTCRFEGVDYGDIDTALLLSRFSVAPQESRHFARTIRENVSLVADNPEYEAAWRERGRVLGFDDAYLVSQLSSDIAEFPEGLDEVLGENGINLSGGQKQRLAILRALVKPHQILVLDDVVSAVDHHTEQEILKALYARLSDQTLVFISHRISALIPCDEIWIIEDGCVVDKGSHTELLSRHDVYRRTYEHQVLEQRVGGVA